MQSHEENEKQSTSDNATKIDEQETVEGTNNNSSTGELSNNADQSATLETGADEEMGSQQNGEKDVVMEDAEETKPTSNGEEKPPAAASDLNVKEEEKKSPEGDKDAEEGISAAETPVTDSVVASTEAPTEAPAEIPSATPAGTPAAPPPPVLRGTLSYNLELRRHLIRGMWNYENSNAFPAQRFELLRNLDQDEDPAVLPKDGEFFGSFSLAYFHTTSKGKQKERSKVIPESGVKIKFTKIEEEETSRLMAQAPTNLESSTSTELLLQVRMTMASTTLS